MNERVHKACISPSRRKIQQRANTTKLQVGWFGSPSLRACRWLNLLNLYDDDDEKTRVKQERDEYDRWYNSSACSGCYVTRRTQFLYAHCCLALVI